MSWAKTLPYYSNTRLLAERGSDSRESTILHQYFAYPLDQASISSIKNLHWIFIQPTGLHDKQDFNGYNNGKGGNSGGYNGSSGVPMQTYQPPSQPSSSGVMESKPPYGAGASASPYDRNVS